MILRSEWQSVNAHAPCPVCGKPDWCRVTSDRAIVACRRESKGAYKREPDKNGATIYFHHRRGADTTRRQGPKRRQAAAKVTAGPEAAAIGADPATLDRAYREFLSLLRLSDKHRGDLRRRGLTDEEIDKRGYRSLPHSGRAEIAKKLVEELGTIYAHVPGFLPDAKLAGAPGLLIPIRDIEDQIIAIKIRADDPGRLKKRYTYLSSSSQGGPGPGSPTHIPVGVGPCCERLRITEGELKADIATALSGIPTISFSGASNWRTAIPAAKQLGARTIVLAFDADARENEMVARSLRDAVAELHREGLIVELEQWPIESGKGIDDVLAGGVVPALVSGEAVAMVASEIATSAGVELRPLPEERESEIIAASTIGSIKLTVSPRNGKTKRKVVAKVGAVQHVDLFDVSSATARCRFAQDIIAKSGCAENLAEIEAELIRLGEGNEARGIEVDEGDKEKGAGRKNQATIALELISDWELWRSPEGDGYVTIRESGRRQTYRVKSSPVRKLISKLFFEATGRAINAEALASAVNTLDAQATFSQDVRRVFLRTAEHGDNLYLDLGDDTWKAIEIAPGGWKIVPEPPVMFRRPQGMLALPTPEHGGQIEELLDFLNLDDENFALAVAWLLATFRPTGPYPILALFAQQGSGKSTAAKMLRSLIDPAHAPLRCEPSCLRDLAIAANNTAILAFDNISSIPSWLSDALCRLSTGGGFATRELFTNDGEAIFDAMRPVLLTSIEDVATRSDLLDRSMIVVLSRIPERNRKPESQLYAEFDQARPRILGALLTAVAAGRQNLPNTSLTSLPRMADFALWTAACESGFGWTPGTFLAAYEANRSSANEIALESSIIAKPLLDYLERSGGWQGTAAGLLAALDSERGEEGRPVRGWPAQPQHLSGMIRRLAPNLEAVGWVVHFCEKARPRILTISRTELCLNSSSGASAATNEVSGELSSGESDPAEDRWREGSTTIALSSDDGDAPDALSAPLLDGAFEENFDYEEGEA